MNENDVTVGSRWRGITGNLMVVREVEGDEALLCYANDPDDSFWESRADIAAYLTFAGGGW